MDDDEEYKCPDCGEMVENGEDCRCADPEEKEECECTDGPGEKNAGGYTEKKIAENTPTDDFTPEKIEFLRNMSCYKSEVNKRDLPGTLLFLTQKFAEDHCKIRAQCDMIGMIDACFSCLTQHVLVPDIQKKAGNDFIMWACKPSPGGK